MDNKNTRRGETQNKWVGQVLPDNAPAKGHFADFIVKKNNPYCQVEPDLHQQLRGFTLIELLVVVLIIGILAAVALPQYQLAVIKSHVAAYLPLMKAINDAETSYYLANGEPSKDISKLDINIPPSCTPLQISGERMFACGNDFLFDNSSYEVILSYCPGHNTSHESCGNNRDFLIVFYNNDYKNNAKECIVKNNSSLGTKICKSLVF